MQGIRTSAAPAANGGDGDTAVSWISSSQERAADVAGDGGVSWSRCARGGLVNDAGERKASYSGSHRYSNCVVVDGGGSDGYWRS